MDRTIEHTRAIGVRWLLAALLAAVATGAMVRTAAAQAPAPPGPGSVEVMLVKNALTAVNQGNLTGNYTVLRDLGSAGFRDKNSAARLAAIFRRSALVVTNDTGPMHLAVATGAPVLAVLLAEDGARWSHAGRFESVAVRGSDQREQIDQVFAAARRLLAA